MSNVYKREINRQLRRQKKRLDRRAARKADRQPSNTVRASYGVRRRQRELDRALAAAGTKEASTQTYGAAIPRVYGQHRVRGAVIWSTDLRPYFAQFDPNAVGQAGGADPNEPLYKASFAVSLCKGEMGKVLRLWANGELIWTSAPTGGYTLNALPAFDDKIKIYLGTETQTVDATIEAEEGTGNAPAYRGLCYVVFKDLPLGQFGDQLPEIEAEVVSAVTQAYTAESVTGLALNSGEEEYSHLSLTTQLLYQLGSSGQLYVVDRGAVDVVQEYDLQAYVETLSPTATVYGAPAVDEALLANHEPLYFFCEDGGDGFLLKWHEGALGTYASKLTGETYASGYVYGNRLYTASADGCTLRAYDRATLTLLWSRTGPDSGAQPGNFTRDLYGNFWLISWKDSDSATGVSSRFWLTRFSQWGVVSHYEFTGKGRCRRVAVDVYSSTSHRLFVGGGDGGDLHKYTCPNTGTPVFVATAAGKTGDNQRGLWVSQARFQGGADGSFWSTNGTTLYELKPSDLSTRRSIALSLFGSLGTLKNFAYDKIARCVFAAKDSAPYLYKLYLEKFAVSSPTLGSTVSDICLAAGLVAGEIDVTDLNATSLKGFLIGDRMSAAEALEVLALAYRFDVREHFASGYSNIKLQFLKRGGASVATLTEDDLGAGEERAEEAPLVEERDDEEKLPRRVTVRYCDPQRLYATQQQQSQFVIDSSSLAARAELDLDLTQLAFTADQAKTLARITRDQAYVEASIKHFRLDVEHLYLEAYDVVTLTVGSDSYRLRLLPPEISGAWVLDQAGVVEDAEIYSASATGVEGPSPLESITIQSPTRLFLLDIPCLRDIDDNAGYYVAAGKLISGASWSGATVYRSLEGHAYQPIAGFEESSTWGVTTDALPDGETDVWDYVSTVTVRVIDGTLSSSTEAACVADRLHNLLAVGNATDGWELLQFATVTNNGNGTYTLSTLLRGRFGTEWRTASHAIGDTALLIDLESGATKRVVTALSDLALERFFRAPTFGTTVGAVHAQLFTDNGVSLKPYTVRQVQGTQHTPSTDDWAISWTRRSRVGADLIDYEDAALGEVDERYEVDILNGSGGAVLRTISVGPTYPATSGVDLEIVASTCSRNFGSGSFITDGFFVGQWVELAGFTNADNNNRFQITALSALVMTLSGSVALVNEASASGRTVTAVSPACGYTAAQQTTDFGVVKGSFYIRIYQISTALETADIDSGRGYSEEIQIL